MRKYSSQKNNNIATNDLNEITNCANHQWW